ncbi:YopX family protein [Staphylococcus devriesei]|uniref:YopX protein domain-containing protein n=1 Tax=Staphylococcus devriesei TaxID=586733 RepID=A0A2T4KT31_9STAP|nr:YopX family protein [Staphylococcus devriesei]PTF12009.1 hypothetical protein BUY48_10035 [Staphylococcus devriesei]
MIPRFREWDAEREKLFKGKGMSYGVRKDFDNSFVIEFEHMEDLDAINKDGSIDRVVMMSTGLKDKNGTEIYEGDIVKNIYDEIYVVKWFDADFHLEEKYNGGFDYFELYSGDNKKVIGNIYENPELLEGE